MLFRNIVLLDIAVTGKEDINDYGSRVEENYSNCDEDHIWP